MTNTFLKSTTAIVLSLSLALPTVTMAQTAAELEAALDVDTTGMTEAELEVLREQYAQQQAQAATEAAEEAPAEEESLLDRAVGAATDAIDNLTGDGEAAAEAEAPAVEAPAAEAQAEAGAATDTPVTTTETTTETQVEATAAPTEEQPTEAAEAPAEDAQPEAVETTEAPVEAAPAEEPATESAEAPADEPVTQEPVTESTETQVETTEAPATAEAPAAEASTDADATVTAETEATGTEKLQAEVDDLKSKLDALTNESAEEQAARQAASEAAAAEAQTTSMAATADADADAEVVEQTVTEETSRSSSEEFATSAASTTAAPAANTAAPKSSGLDELGRVALFGLGALAVGQILKNGSEVVSNSGDRVVVQQSDGSYKVLKNDDVLMFQPGTDVKTYAFDDGSTRTVATRNDGTQIETIRAADGTVLRRTRVLTDGTRVVLFDDTQVAQQVEVNKLPQVTKTRNSINIQQAQEDELRAALAAKLPQEVDRRFSLSQVRNITAVRGLVPEIDVDNITFETGSSTIRPAEAEELAQLGTLMRQRIAENPGEVFLIEGHTDAVGSASYNLALSDRRAESVALALTEYFEVPPENMVVQGYGESDLKVRTAMAERENRRAAVRRITPLLTGN
ncbi:OmpA family protein [Pseudooceanicola onchidii]|uniref:OmpA family protein n=1 Tax=Pseudooceanicola onchidii TaxID=2562279 RepID=UPI0010A9C02A|nr:OmpA family protein [Pseudooceanicola onchidii]